jgi:hypothetical protein
MRSLWFLLSSAFAVAASAAPGTLQGRFEIEFEVTCEGTVVAEVVERLEISGSNYQMTESSKGRGMFALLGTAKRTSRGQITKDGVLQPLEFSDERTGRDTARVWFDWKAQTITMQYSGRKGSEDMPPPPSNSQDRLSFLLAVTLMPGRVQYLKLSIFDGKGQSRHEYDVGGRERVKTPAGEFDAVKITRRTEPGKKDSASMWVASDFGLPVKLVHVERDGKSCEHVAKRISR